VKIPVGSGDEMHTLGKNDGANAPQKRSPVPLIYVPKSPRVRDSALMDYFEPVRPGCIMQIVQCVSLSRLQFALWRETSEAELPAVREPREFNKGNYLLYRR